MLLWIEAATAGVLWKKGFLTNFAKFTENTCARVPFLIKLQAWATACLWSFNFEFWIGSSILFQDYLARFGYFTTKDSRVGALANQKSIIASIKSLQRFSGLKETGYVDNETKMLMKLPRCGLPDNAYNLNTRRKRRFTLQGTTWRKTVRQVAQTNQSFFLKFELMFSN